MAIASKEARETHYWLRLFRDSEICEEIDFSDTINNVEEIVKIITAIIKTTESK